MKRPLQEQKRRPGRKVSPVRRLGFAEELELDLWLSNGRCMAAIADLVEERCSLARLKSSVPAVQERTRQASEEVKGAVEALRRAAELLRDEEGEKLCPSNEVFALVSFDKELTWYLYLAGDAVFSFKSISDGACGVTLSDLAGSFLIRHLSNFRERYDAFLDGYFLPPRNGASRPGNY